MHWYSQYDHLRFFCLFENDLNDLLGWPLTILLFIPMSHCKIENKNVLLSEPVLQCVMEILFVPFNY